MPDIIITPSSGKLEFVDTSAQSTRRHSFTMDANDGLNLDAHLSAAAISAPLNVINVTVNNSNANYPFVLAQSGETGAKNLLMDGAGGTYNPFTNTATIDISGNSATTTLASNSTNLGGVAAASYVTLTGTQTLTNKTITGTFTGNLTGTGSWATNAVNANTATNSTQLNGQSDSYYTNIPARLGYTPVNKAGDTISGNLTVNGNFAVNGSVTAFSASNIYITSSTLTVTDNILLMNALSPYQRYAGIQMYDSGSGTVSQFLWDGEGDYFFLTGSSVNGKIITGPDGQTNLTSNFIPKATAGYKLGNSLIYDNGTNVGIGTTSPVSKLHIEQIQTAESLITLRNDRQDLANVAIFGISAQNGVTTVSKISFYRGDGGNSGYLTFSTKVDNASSLTEKVRIDGAGNVGIGTTSPATKLDVVGDVTMPAIKQSATLYNGTDISDDNSTRTVYFNIPAGGYSPITYFKVARIKITGNYQNVSLNGYFTAANSALHVGFERKVEFDFIAYAATNAGAPQVTYIKRGQDTTTVLVYAVANGGGAGTTYYDVYIKHGWYNDTHGELAIRVGYSSAVTVWQAGLDSGTSAPVDTLVNPNSNYNFDTTGFVGIGTTTPSRKLHVYSSGLSDNTVNPLLLIDGKFTAAGVDSNDIVGIAFRVENSAGGSQTTTCIGSSYQGAGNALLLQPVSGNVGVGTINPSFKLDIGAVGNDVVSVRLTPGYERVRYYGFDLLGYNDGNLWMIGNNPTNTLVLGKTWDWDNQIGIAYTPGTVGNSGGILQIGQISKNNANYTHGITRLYTNGLERITIIANGNVGISTTLPTTPLHVVGVISGSSFSGAGTGLTGTASGLSIGGSAATWTTARTLTIGSTGKSVNGSADVSWSLTELGVGNGTITIAAGTGVGVGTTNTFTTNQSGATTVTITNTGVTSNVAGTGISVSGATGAVTITNSGVTSAVAGTGVSVSGATGAVTFSIGQAVGTGNSPTFAAVTTSTDGANLVMAGTTNAEGIRMTPASSTTYPVFLRSLNPGVGEASPWIYKEQATDWGIWHNNPINSIDFTKAGSGGIASNVGGSSTNTVTVRVEMATGYVQTIAGYRNSAGTTILSDAGNITGNAATATILQTARNIGGVSFNGSADINLPGVNTAGNQNTSGNAATATTATTANALNTSNSYTGVNFTATGFFQTNLGQIKSDTSFALLTTSNGAQSVSVRGILLGTSYDTTPGANEIRTTNNTSLFLNARGTGDIQFQTADSLKMMLLNNGNVGIGTSSPTAKVESYYSSNAITFNYLATNLNVNSPIPVYGFDVTSGAESRSIKAGIGYERHLPNGRGTLHFYNDSTNDTQSLAGNRTTAGDIKMSLDNSGNLGIGTTQPSWLLTVYAASAPQFTLQNGTRSFILTNNAGDNLLSFNYGGVNRLQFDTTNQWFNTGNLGVGNTSPQYKLHVTQATPSGQRAAPANTSIQVDSNTNNYISLVNTADNGTYAGLTFVDNNIGGYIVFRNYTGDVTTGSDSLIYGTFQDHIFQNSSSETINGKTETMRIKQNGNVGIGSNNPQSKLDVNGVLAFGGVAVLNTVNNANDIYANIRVIRNTSSTSADGMYINYDSLGTTSAHIRFYANAGNERMRIQANDGNVGIGTTSAGRKLDVEGIVRTRGASGTGGFEIGAATTGAARWRIEWDSASDSLDFNWVA